MLDQWKILLFSDKVLLAITNLTISIEEDLLEDTLKTGVLRILIDELKDKNQNNIKENILKGLKNLVYLSNEIKRENGRDILCEYFRANLTNKKNMNE